MPHTFFVGDQQVHAATEGLPKSRQLLTTRATPTAAKAAPPKLRSKWARSSKGGRATQF